MNNPQMEYEVLVSVDSRESSDAYFFRGICGADEITGELRDLAKQKFMERHPELVGHEPIVLKFYLGMAGRDKREVFDALRKGNPNFGPYVSPAAPDAIPKIPHK
jgi:hypothetical protein